MKKLLLFILLLPLITSALKADLESCVVYHTKFYLKNGAVFNGCFVVCTEYEEAERNKNLYNNAGIFTIFKREEQELKSAVTVYKNIHYAYLRPIHKRSNEDPEKYVWVIPADIVLLDSKHILKMVFQKAQPPWTASGMIEGTKDMLDTIQHRKYWNSLFFSSNNPDQYTLSYENFGPDGGYALYNYNAHINMAELKRLARLKFPINREQFLKYLSTKNKVKIGETWTPEVERIYRAARLEKIMFLRKWFWKKGILLVEIQGSC